MEQMLDMCPFLEHFENAWPAEALMRYKLQRCRLGCRALNPKTPVQPAQVLAVVPTQTASGRTIKGVSGRGNVGPSGCGLPDRDRMSSSTPRWHPVAVALIHTHPVLQLCLIMARWHALTRYVAV